MVAYSTYWNKEIETMPFEKMVQLQKQKLQSQMKYVYETSAFYREKFDKAKAKPTDIINIKDLQNLPFTEKEELRISLEKSPPLGEHCAASLENVIRIHGSSGTTGRPTFIGLTRRDCNMWDEVAARCVWAIGYRPNHIITHCFNYALFVGGVSDHLGTEKMGATVVPVGVGQAKRLARILDDFKVDGVTATASYFFHLAGVVKEELGKDPKELGIKILACGAEPGAGIPATRRKVEEIWGGNAYDVTGLSDVFGWHGGECEYKQGMHFGGPDFCIMEVIDPDTGKAKEISEEMEGEVVYTMIEREASPLIRFRSHDHVMVWTSPCECGRTTWRFRIVGRTDDMLIVKGVNVFPSAVEDVIRTLTPEVTGEFQILLEKPSPLPDLKIKIEYGSDSKPQDLTKLKEKIEKRFSEILLFKANVELIPPMTIPRVEYKPKRVYKLYTGEKP